MFYWRPGRLSGWVTTNLVAVPVPDGGVGVEHVEGGVAEAGLAVSGPLGLGRVAVAAKKAGRQFQLFRLAGTVTRELRSALQEHPARHSFQNGQIVKEE